MRFPRHWDMITSGCGLFFAQLRMVNPTVFTLWQESKMSPPYRIYRILRKESFPKLIFRNSNWRWLNLFPNQFMVVSASTLHLHTPFFGSVGLTILFSFFSVFRFLAATGFSVFSSLEAFWSHSSTFPAKSFGRSCFPMPKPAMYLTAVA